MEIKKKCPHCGYNQYIPVDVVIENNKIRIEEPYITCDACMDLFEISISFRVKAVVE